MTRPIFRPPMPHLCVTPHSLFIFAHVFNYIRTMKKISITAISMLILAACNNAAQQQGAAATDSIEQTQEAPITGGDRDEHGCIPSAGQSWSELRQECIQVFNVGTRLDPVEQKEGEAVISAFVIFNDDRSKAEIFLPGSDSPKSVILTKAEDDGTYKADRYAFNDAEQALYIDGKKTFAKK